MTEPEEPQNIIYVPLKYWFNKNATLDLGLPYMIPSKDGILTNIYDPDDIPSYRILARNNNGGILIGPPAPPG